MELPVLMAVVITRYCWSSLTANSSSIESNKSSLPLKIVSRNFTYSTKWMAALCFVTLTTIRKEKSM